MSQETILMTGATGNVGAVTLEHLLALKHRVNIVLRREFSIPWFKNKFPDAVSSGHLLFTPIPDMSVSGVFDSAASTATAIFHIATPLATSNFVENMVEPTWAIDHNVLEAAKKSTTVKRVVICGTILQIASIEQFFDPTLTLSEKDFNGIELTPGVDEWLPAYQVAKTQAEIKTWVWVEENEKKGKLGFDVVMLLPPAITGRSPQEGFRPSGENPGGIGGIYKALLNRDGGAGIDGVFPFWLDTDDVARTHIAALDKTKVPGNDRYVLASSELFDLRAVANRLRKESPEWMRRVEAVEELPVSRFEGKFAAVDTARADKVFGTDWKSAYESVKETVADVVEWEKNNGA